MRGGVVVAGWGEWVGDLGYVGCGMDWIGRGSVWGGGVEGDYRHFYYDFLALDFPLRLVSLMKRVTYCTPADVTACISTYIFYFCLS